MTHPNFIIKTTLILITVTQASKDELSFDKTDDFGGSDRKRAKKSGGGGVGGSSGLLDTLGSTLEKPDDFQPQPAHPVSREARFGMKVGQIGT